MLNHHSFKVVLVVGDNTVLARFAAYSMVSLHPITRVWMTYQSRFHFE